MSELLKKISVKKDRATRQTWVVPACFGMSCLFTVLSVVLLCIRGFDTMEPEWIFSVSADIFCMAVCAMLCFSATLNPKSQNDDTRVFVTLLITNALALFTDEVCWLVQGIPGLAQINLVANVLFFMMGSVLIYLFWEYIRRALRLNDRPMRIADMFVTVMLYPSLILCLINFFYPLFFEIGADGFYRRAAQWDVSQVYLSITLTVVIISIICSKASKKDRFVAVSFIAIPMLNQILTANIFGLSTQYAAMTVSIVLIYGVLFAEREKVLASTEMELGVATRIQADMLPGAFPFLPERTEFDLYASMTPAREVGGDFYDFFMVDDNRLALVIADVSGKGIPAALFMMASKILIKNTVMTGKSPGEALAAVNNQICESNHGEMFVTVWLGILSLDDGTLVTANAGHEYPVIKIPGGGFELKKSKHSFVVGGMKGIKYKESSITLEPDSKLFVYTDGVPEAENEQEEQYGCDRLIYVLNKNKNADPHGLLDAVSADVGAFVCDRSQFDDLTMLCVHYRGRAYKELTVPATVDNIDDVTDFVNGQLEELGCPPKVQMQIAIVIDELFGNIAKYAYAPGTGDATVQFGTEKGGTTAVIRFIDNGRQFDPLNQAEPDVHAPASERKEGGLGIFLVKKTMSSVEYEYKDGKNILTVKKDLQQKGKAK